MKKLIAIFGLMALAACGGGDAEGEGAEATNVDSTVTTVPGSDTVSQPVVVPTQDSVVTTTTTQTSTDTLQGQATTGATTGATTTDTAAH